MSVGMQLVSRRVLPGVAVAVALAAGAPSPSGAASAAGAKACPAGHVAAVVRGRQACVPAPDLRVLVAGTPRANRVGGTFTYRVVVANRGRRAAVGVGLSIQAGGEAAALTPSVGSCPRGGNPLRVSCRLGTLAPGSRAVVTVGVRGTALGTLRLSVRAASSLRDARPADNAASAATRVTPPDSVRGAGVRPTSGTFFRPPVSVEVDAISGPEGHDPAGTFSTSYSPQDVIQPGLQVRGRVTCLTVVGNRATVGGVIEQTVNDPPGVPKPPGSGILLLFTDNGEPGAGRDTTLTYFTANPPSECPVPLPGQNAPEIPLSEGDFVVHDERP